MSKNKQKKLKRERPKSKTKLWLVGMGSNPDTGKYCILVQPKNHASQVVRRSVEIRSISGNAAGRKYKKYNLPFNWASDDGEWNNWGGSGKPEKLKEYKEEIAKGKKRTNHIKIVVQK